MNETMRREILAQPVEVERALPILRQRVDLLAPAPVRRIFAGGCGDSFYASQVAAHFFASDAISYCPVTSFELCHYRRLRPGDLCVLVSISGGTRRTIDAALAARNSGARTLAITCGAQSPLAASCDETFLLPFTPISRRTPHTLDYTMTVVALATLAERLVGQRLEWLDGLAPAIAATIRQAQPCAIGLLAEANSNTRWFFLGGGPGRGLASYGAAKFHEAGGLAAMSAELENFMHGMNFMLEPDDHVCLLAHDQPSHRRAMRVAASLATIGVRPWHVRPDGTISVDGGPPDLTEPGLALITSALPLQLLCLETADSQELPVESPPARDRHLRAQGDYLRE